VQLIVRVSGDGGEWTGLVARLIQSLGQFDADTVLEDRRWPMARPYRRLADAPIAGVRAAP
jgi:hypothetical protein